jgi:ABC-type antimicrobial peptide transport system permease subunit
MNLISAIDFSVRNVLAHPFRTILTMLGIILGVSSLVAMTAMVKGMEKGMKESMIAMGGLDKVLISEDGVPSEMDHLADLAPGRTFRDVYALRSNASLLKVVSPELRADDRNITYGHKRTWPSELVGVWPAVLEMNLFEVEHGRFFCDMDEELALSVCVIGTGIRDELFGSPEKLGFELIPIGKWININGQPFRIVGMFRHYESERDRKIRELEAKRRREQGQQSGPARQKGWGGSKTWGNPFWRKNNTVYIPMRTMWLKFPRYLEDSETGTLIPDTRLTDIDIKVRSMETMDKALQQARNVLGITHHGILDYEFRTQESGIEDINKRIRNARLSGGIISGLSLLIGGIGIMNIMFASIQERIREIGTCKALGASGSAVFFQVVTESIVVCILGALVGMGASLGVVELLEWLSPTQNSPVITPAALMTASACSIIIGMLAGIFPALKAARMSPMEALKY